MRDRLRHVDCRPQRSLRWESLRESIRALASRTGARVHGVRTHWVPKNADSPGSEQPGSVERLGLWTGAIRIPRKPISRSSATEHRTPPGSSYALLSFFRRGVRLCSPAPPRPSVRSSPTPTRKPHQDCLRKPLEAILAALRSHEEPPLFPFSITPSLVEVVSPPLVAPPVVLVPVVLVPPLVAPVVLAPLLGPPVVPLVV